LKNKNTFNINVENKTLLSIGKKQSFSQKSVIDLYLTIISFSFFQKALLFAND